MRIVKTDWASSATKYLYPLSKCVRYSFLLLFLFLFVGNFSLLAQHDLSVAQTSNLDSAGVGDVVAYTVILYNNGQTEVNDVEVRNALPVGTSLVGNTPSVGTFDTGTGIWDVGTIATITDSVILTLQVQLDNSGVHTNIAQISNMSGFDVDSEPNDNVVTDDDYASACVSVPYKICQELQDTVILTAPSGYNNYVWLMDGNIISGATDSVYKATLPGKYTFTVDEMVTDCPASSCCPIQIDAACFDLALDKKLATGQSTIVSPGDDVTYTFTIHNQGQYFADSILVTDYPASGMTNNAANWENSDTLLTVASGALPAGGLAPGGTRTVDITLTIGENVSADSLINFGEITEAKDVSQTDNRDVDSTPDDINGNDGGGASNSAADDYVDGNGTSTVVDGVALTDEDDHDPEVIYICPNITNPSPAITVCEGSTVPDLSVNSTNADVNGISFVYFNSQQTGDNRYSGGTPLRDTTTVAGVARITNVAFPTTPGIYYVYAIINPTPPATSCRPSQEIQVTIENQPEAGSQATPLDLCETSTTTVTLADELTGDDTGGTWTADGSNPSGGTFAAGAGTFDPTGASVGTYTFKYKFDAGTACLADSALVTINIENQPEAGNQATPLDLCETSTTTVILADELTGDDTGGTWTADGSNPSGGTFTAGAGTFNPTGASVGTYTFKYKFDAGTACLADSALVTINIENQPEAGNQATPLVVCEGSTTTVTLADELTGDDTGGTWTAGGTNPSGGTFNAGAGTFNLTGANAGTYTFTYAFAAGTVCVADQATVTITVNPQPLATLAVSDTTLCNGGMASIRISNTQTGVSYQLRDNSDDSPVGIAMFGNMGTLTFTISPVTASIDYNVLATDTASTCAIELTDMAAITVVDCDFGDLVDTGIDTAANNYQTQLENGGPFHHIIPDLRLGATVDGEPNGQQSPLANGDAGDEDGITFFSSLNIVPGGTIRLPLSVLNGTGNTAHLEAWIDWNADGRFSGPEEMIIDTSGGATFPPFVLVNIPDVIADSTPLGVRFRLSLEDNMTPYGEATSGEIEDYLIQVDCATGVCLPISSTVLRGTR
ncbi:MAG: DUF11 domain-containing protein [Bacteroidota bacterium]